jgi:hypothetical protein
MDDRRSTDRTSTSKAASLLFGRQSGEHACEVEVRDLANGGAGIYKPGLAVLPLTFELSFDNLRRKCRMVWRRGNFFGVAFEDQSPPNLGESEIGEPGIAIEGPELAMLSAPPLLAGPDDVEGLAEFTAKIGEQNNNGRSDARFIIGVAIALAMPVLISLGAYIATTAAIRAG